MYTGNIRRICCKAKKNVKKENDEFVFLKDWMSVGRDTTDFHCICIDNDIIFLLYNC